MITQPTGLTLRDWADQVTFELSTFGLIPRLDNDNWQLWGDQLSYTSTVGDDIPDPSSFENWFDWAQRFCEVIQ